MKPAGDDTLADANTGETLTFVTTAEHTGGEHVVIHLTLAPGTVVALHAHPVEETFERLEGHAELTVAGRPVDVVSNPVVTVPPGELHGICNTSAEPAHPAHHRSPRRGA